VLSSFGLRTSLMFEGSLLEGETDEAFLLGGLRPGQLGGVLAPRGKSQGRSTGSHEEHFQGTGGELGGRLIEVPLKRASLSAKRVSTFVCTRQP
jgi:hypothetical protein